MTKCFTDLNFLTTFFYRPGFFTDLFSKRWYQRLASLAARSLPTILPGLTTGLLSGGIKKAISGSGDGFYLHKHDKCYRVKKCKGNGLYLAPHPRLLLKHGNDINAGLLMGRNTPFKNIPVLGWLL